MDDKLKTGTTTVGIKCKDGIVFAADKRATAGTVIANKKIEKVYPVQWDAMNNRFEVMLRTGKCRHLSFDGNTAVCKIYDDRPKQCREYYCDKEPVKNR